MESVTNESCMVSCVWWLDYLVERITADNLRIDSGWMDSATQVTDHSQC